MKSMKTCADCRFCKVNLSEQTLRCSQGVWLTQNSSERIFKLAAQEYHGYKSWKNNAGFSEIKLIKRKVFQNAESCGYFTDDWEGDKFSAE